MNRRLNIVKNTGLLLSAIFLLMACGNKSIFSDAKRVKNISVLYPDSTSINTKIVYNSDGRMVQFEEVTEKNGSVSTFAIDSILYKGDTVVMYDYNNNRTFYYFVSEGLALECYMTSEKEGTSSALFHYIDFAPIRIYETRSLSFSNKQDTVFHIQYNEKGALVGFRDRYNKYSFTPSQEKNKDRLLLPPIHYGVYTPAYYAGIIGKTSAYLIDHSTSASGEKNSYDYTTQNNETTVTMTNERNEITTYTYRTE
ncbi:hypothetical protein [Dysgonomonas sp. 520]|uniref:hypothetical protein n=1 Tax=Dysgonomonas sp. 520 TaxID=2302931 RepID=UPI0013D4F72B|nr:hypothetical protein [Dysgonomonas sp. 520]NDW09522.1 hypothetical protein [Dysgonomonas sp. 520]